MATKAIARVQVTVTLSKGIWGEGATIQQVYDQAAEETENLIRNKFGSLVQIDCVKVTAVLTENQG